MALSVKFVSFFFYSLHYLNLSIIDLHLNSQYTNSCEMRIFQRWWKRQGSYWIENG